MSITERIQWLRGGGEDLTDDRVAVAVRTGVYLARRALQHSYFEAYILKWKSFGDWDKISAKVWNRL